MQTYWLNTQRVGGLAAYVNALLAIAALVVLFGLIGPAALTDNTQLVELAINNPAPLVIQDLLKFTSAAVASVLVVALFNRLRGEAPAVMGWATLFGFLSILCLLANASLSLYAVSQAANSAQGQAELGKQLNGLAGLVGLAVIAVNGLWYLLVSWSALKTNQLPRPLSYLGLVMGGLSLLPALGIIVLLLSVVWSAWLGQTLLRSHQSTPVPATKNATYGD
ncbi:MAG: DUF4386 family protein [Anaerolineales bacterium]|nr:DUF4386 family protein [Anaerolineales bacterium]